MGKAFFTYWDQAEWETGDRREYKEVAPFVDDFVLTRRGSAERESFWQRLWGKLTAFAGRVVDEFRFDQFTRGHAVVNHFAVKGWFHPEAKDVPPPSEHR
eukprot:Sspe_Gene.87953::Locus_60038_Transcript_1_1_Confidence_1.000_Length_300::g.87953::m.87953